MQAPNALASLHLLVRPSCVGDGSGEPEGPVGLVGVVGVLGTPTQT